MKRIFAILLPLLLLFAACAPKLTRRTTVTLTVQSEAPEYTVSASYGRLSHEGDVYTLALPDIRDVILTVSADGYETVNVRVTADDMLRGDTVRTAVLSEPRLIEVSITLTGRTENASVTCAGVNLVPDGYGVFSADLSAAQLRQGIVATAENAEPRTFFFPEKAYRETFLEEELALVAKGTKCVELFGIDADGIYVLDDDGRLIDITVRGTRSCCLEVPKQYKGGLHVRYFSHYAGTRGPYDTIVFYLSDSEEAYGGQQFGTILDEDNSGTQIRFDSDALFEVARAAGVVPQNFDETWDGMGRMYWLETDRVLCAASHHPDGGLIGTVSSGTVVQTVLKLPEGEKLLALYAGDPFHPHAVITLKEGYGDTVTADFLDVHMEEARPTDGIMLTVMDTVTGQPYTGDVFYRDGSPYPGVRVSTGGTPFAWQEGFFYNLSGMLGDVRYTGTSRLLGEDDAETNPAWCIYKEGGALRMTINCTPTCTYRVRLLRDGVPVTGAHLIGDPNIFQTEMTELSPGVYEASRRHLDIRLTEGENERMILTCDENWKRVGHEYTLTYDLGAPVTLCYLVFYAGSSFSMTLTEISSVQVLSGECEIFLPSFASGSVGGYMSGIYMLVRARYGEQVRFRIDSVISDEAEQSAFRDSRIVELDIKKEYDRLINGDVDYLQLYTFPTA